MNEEMENKLNPQRLADALARIESRRTGVEFTATVIPIEEWEGDLSDLDDQVS